MGRSRRAAPTIARVFRPQVVECVTFSRRALEEWVRAERRAIDAVQSIGKRTAHECGGDADHGHDAPGDVRALDDERERIRGSLRVPDDDDLATVRGEAFDLLGERPRVGCDRIASAGIEDLRLVSGRAGDGDDVGERVDPAEAGCEKPGHEQQPEPRGIDCRRTRRRRLAGEAMERPVAGIGADVQTRAQRRTIGTAQVANPRLGQARRQRWKRLAIARSGPDAHAASANTANASR